jgi:FixJ family two-component response regulator
MVRRKRQFFAAIVDDDAAMRAAIQRVLNAHGFPTRGFSSAERFLRSSDGRTAACLVLDVRLPGMSGPELQQKLHATGLAIPAIFVTAEADTNIELQKLLQCGAVAALHKPFDPERLVELVHAVHGAQRQR